MKYASDTLVPVDRSQAEVRAILRRYGADGFAFAEKGHKAMIGFDMGNRRIKILLPLPDPNAEEFLKTPSRKWERHSDDAQKVWEKACRQRWRALTLYIKAKLEAIECGIISLDEAFLAHIVLPDGGTAGDFLLPQIAESYRTRQMPQLLPGLGFENKDR